MVDKVRHALLAMQRHSWEQGVAMQALLEMGDTQAVILFAKEAAYRSMADGRVAAIGGTDGATDPCCAGEALLYASRLTMDPDLLSASQNLERWALESAPRSESGIVYHLTTRPEFWVDSIYMLPPYLMAAGHHINAVQQLMGYYNALHDNVSGLMSHIWDEKNRRFVREAHWGVGNGWAASGMARVIALLPESSKEEKRKIIRMATDLIDSLLNCMREDGLFHDVVDDPNTFVETNLSQMLAYTLLRGMSDGWLSKEKYSGYSDKLRAAVIKKVDAYGLVQSVCGAPTFDKPGVAPEGQAFFLMMEAAYQKNRKTSV